MNDSRKMTKSPDSEAGDRHRLLLTGLILHAEFSAEVWVPGQILLRDQAGLTPG